MKNNAEILYVLGPAGSFSHLAALRVLKTVRAKKWRIRFVPTFQGIFQRVEKKGFGIVPVRNKIIGLIPDVFSNLKKGEFIVLSKLRMPIRMVLAGRSGSALNTIREVYATPIVASQCRKFLSKGRFIHTQDASQLASCVLFKKIVQLKGRRAMEKAAIGSVFAAKKYGLKVLARNIQDDPKDWTEFAVITKA